MVPGGRPHLLVPSRAGRSRSGRDQRTPLPTVAAAIAGALCAAVVVAGCGSSTPSLAAQAQQQAYLNDVHETAADVNQYRTDTELIRLGHAVCDDLRSGASYGTIADRLGTTTGASTLPTFDLGAVITSAARVLCPSYADRVT